MRKRLRGIILSLVMCISLIAPNMKAYAAETLYDNRTGTQDGYSFELWKDYGNTSMTLNAGGTFECSWSNIGNALFRKGQKFDSSRTYQQMGNISVDYGCNYQPNGNSYLCVYGWMKNPLVEYYIVDSWGSWRPPGASPKGQITVDGGTYDVYETTRYNQPSIEGNTTFQQYWSVRTSKRTSGTISVTEHFKAWERMGMRCGNLYETALTVEGYQSSGTANVYRNVLSIGGNGGGNNGGYNGGGNQGGNQSGNQGGNQGGNSGSTSGDTIQCESMTKSGTYTGNINNPFNGVALYANNDAVSYTQYFGYGTHDFTLRACSNNNNMARVDLHIGGEYKGTFYYGGSYPAEYTIKNVSHKTGNQEVKLVVTADDGNWDAFLDYLKIGGAQGSNNGGNNGGNNSGNQGGNNTGYVQPQPQPSGKLVALTFDDGPSSTTNDVLDVLERYGVKATFFLIGQNVNSNTMSIMQRQVRMGCELANHTYTHEDLAYKSAQDIKNQVAWCSSAIKNTVGVDVKFFRAPNLSVNNTVYQNVDLAFINGITCNDWESYVSAQQRANTVINSVQDGSIVLLHDFQGNNNTVQALPTIIQTLKNQGYTFVTLSELFEAKGVNPNQRYKSWSRVP